MWFWAIEGFLFSYGSGHDAMIGFWDFGTLALAGSDSRTHRTQDT